MNSARNLALLLLFYTLTLSTHAQVRAALETFTYETNANSWSVYDFTSSLPYPAEWIAGEDPVIRYHFTDNDVTGNDGFLFSSYGGSNNSFDGNHALIRSGGIGFDLEVENPANISFIDVAFWSVTDNRWFYSSDIQPSDSSKNWQSIDFFNNKWYYYDSGWVTVELTKTNISNIDRFIIRSFPASAAAVGEFVAIDNFTIYPEIIVPKLKVSRTGNIFSMNFLKWAGQSYTAKKSTTGLDSGDFVDMPGALTTAGGNLALSLSEPISGTAFWKVDTQIQYVEVPEVTP